MIKLFLLTVLLMVVSKTTIAGENPSAWFGARWGLNGLAIVPKNVNRKYVSISAGVDPVVDAFLFFDANGSLNITDKAKWSGDVSVVPKGPFRGTILAYHSGQSNILTASYITFSDSINVNVEIPNDSDNDKILDSWEIDNFGSLSKTAAGDEDGDGISNLDEFYNGTDPNENKEIFAFPPLHRYPYSNGFYAGPDVNLEWFGSTTLGRYELEVAIFPGCDKIIYRAEVYNTNNIGDPIVHTADLSEGIGTQCAYRIRAAFTNSTGWTEWNNWRPFKVLEPLTNHTLYLENGELLRGIYFFFWDQSKAADYWENVTNTVWWQIGNLNWEKNDEICNIDLSFIKNELNINTVLLDQWVSKLLGHSDESYLSTNFVDNYSVFKKFNVFYDEKKDIYITNSIYWNTKWWNKKFDRDNQLCRNNNIKHIPLMNYNLFNGAIAHGFVSNFYNFNQYLAIRYLGKSYTNFSGFKTVKYRRGLNKYTVSQAYLDITDRELQRVWIGFIIDYVRRYAFNTNKIFNSLLKVNNHGKIMPVVCPVFEYHNASNIRNFSDEVLNEFRYWLSNRYGKISYLNQVWEAGHTYPDFDYSNFNSFDNINPVLQDGTIFQWEWRDGKIADVNNKYFYKYMRACDDFDEFSIERYAKAWLTIKQEVCKEISVCFASELVGKNFYNIDGKNFMKTVAPVHRALDYSDIFMQRVGSYGMTVKQKQSYAEMLKSGKYIITLPMSGSKIWGDSETPYSYQYCAEQIFESGGNFGFYSWNELFNGPGGYIDSMIYSIQNTNLLKRFFYWGDRVANKNLKNGIFEFGINKYIPHWECNFKSRIAITSQRGFVGDTSLKIKGGISPVTLTSELYVPKNENVYVLFYAKVEGKSPPETVTIDINFGETRSRQIIFNKSGWKSESDSKKIYFWHNFHNMIIPTIILPENGLLNYFDEQWISFLEKFDVSGAHKIQLTLNIPQDLTLYLDNFNILDLP